MTVEPLVAHVFRQSAGAIVSALARRLGAARLDLAEEVVQDAMLRALETWPYRAVPDNPGGWLFRVALNRARDLLRREDTLRARLDALGHALDDAVAAERSPVEALGDDTLGMMFACCHPALPHAARVALTLKTVSGFSVPEIAQAFLAEPATVAQRLVRAKRQIRDDAIALEIPRPDELGARLPSVLAVLYLLFTEGYAAHGGENLTRADLCDEAIRLARLLCANPATERPAVHALLALMLLQASRLTGRVDAAGDVLLLGDQDRARWDAAAIAEGMAHLERSAIGAEVTAYHVEAAIAACHAAAGDEASTDWPYVLSLYEDLRRLKPSPIVELNRAIALAMVDGPMAGIEELARLDASPALAGYHLLPAALAALWRRAGAPETAATHYRRALSRPCSAPERRFLERRLTECEAAGLATLTGDGQDTPG